MMNLIDLESDNTVGIKIDGNIRDNEFDAIVSLLKEKMNEHPDVNVYVELESLGTMSPQTILKDLRFGMKNKEQINKQAVVTDQEWVKRLAPIADSMFSEIELQTFSFDQRKQAKQWVQN